MEFWNISFSKLSCTLYTTYLTNDIIVDPWVLVQNLEEDGPCDFSLNLYIMGCEGLKKLCAYIKQEGAALSRKDGVKLATDGLGVLLFLADLHHHVGVGQVQVP